VYVINYYIIIIALNCVVIKS